MKFSSPATHIIDAEQNSRRDKYGLFMSKGDISPIVFDVEHPWVFTHIMVTVSGDVVVYGTDHNLFKLPACQTGIVYRAVGVAISSVGTVATGIYVYGGV